MKRCAFIMVLACFVSVFSWSAGSTETASSTGKNATLTIFLPEEHGPVVADHMYFTGIKKFLGITLVPSSAPVNNYQEKLNLLLASGDLPDIVAGYNWGLPLINEYGPKGAFAVLDLAKMPNYSRWLKGIDKGMKLVQAPDEKVYAARTVIDHVIPSPVVIIRTDLVKKAGIELPKSPYSMEEFYAFLKKVKAAYPNSYLLGSYDQNNMVWSVAPYFGTRKGVFYSFTEKKVVDGRVTPEYRDMLVALANAYKDGIVQPDFLTVTRTIVESDLNMNKLIGYFQYPSHTDAYTNAGRVTNPNFTFEAIDPPQYKGKDVSLNGPTPFIGNQAMAVSSKSKNYNDALRFLDWMYSDEGAVFTNWGIEGTSFYVENGKRKVSPGVWTRESGDPFNNTKLLSPWLQLSIRRHGWYQVKMGDEEAAGGMGPLYRKAFAMYQKYIGPPPPEITLNKTEADRASILKNTISTLLEEMEAKVILGQMSIADWDAAVAKVKSQGLDEVVKMSQAAYDRLYK